MDINKLVEQYPNDMELGAAVRQIYWENKNRVDELSKKMKGAKIFESPDGGKTIYVREFGQEISERKLLDNKEQLSLFSDEIE